MIKAIFWKEWRGIRWYFLIFLVIAGVVTAFRTQLIHDNGRTARSTLFLILSALVVIQGLVFQSQQSSGRFLFLRARPGTNPQLFCIHYFGHSVFLLGLIIMSLLLHCLHMKIIHPDFQLLDILLDPRLLFGLASSLLIFFFIFSFATLGISFGFAAVGAGILALFLVFALFLNSRTLAERLPALSPMDSPVSFLLLVLCAGVLLVFFMLWTISFNEIRDRRNPRWLVPAIAVSVLMLMLIGDARKPIADALRPSFKNGTIKEIIVNRNAYYPLIGIISSQGKESMFGLHPQSARYKNATGKQMVFRIIKLKIDSARSNGNLNYYLSDIFYLSDLPIWGQDIRKINLGGAMSIFAPRNYAFKESFSPPFPQPQGDRVAYLKTSRPRFGEGLSRSVCITALRAPITECITLSNEPGIEYTPIGWDNYGERFVFKKNVADGFEVWAVDWLATNLIELPHSVMTMAADLDMRNLEEWRKLPEQVPVGLRGIAVSYLNFAYRPTEKWLEEKLDLSLLQVKPAPDDNTYAIVAKPTPESAPKLGTYSSSTGRLTWILDEFLQTEEQWGWDGQGIIYAEGKELWQVDANGRKKLIMTTAELEDMSFSKILLFDYRESVGKGMPYPYNLRKSIP